MDVEVRYSTEKNSKNIRLSIPLAYGKNEIFKDPELTEVLRMLSLRLVYLEERIAAVEDENWTLRTLSAQIVGEKIEKQLGEDHDRDNR